MSKITGEINAEMMKKAIHDSQAKLFAEIVSKTGSRQSVIDRTMQEIAALREQVEKLTAERDDAVNSMQVALDVQEKLRQKLTAERDEWKNDAINGGNAGYLREQLAALAEQNEKLKEAINLIYSWANNWDSEFMNDPDWQEKDYPFIQSTISLHNLATPVLNKYRAEGMRMAADSADSLSVLIPRNHTEIACLLRAKANELEKTNGRPDDA